MKINYLNWSHKDNIDTIATLLQKNKIIAGNSDTVAGLLAPLTKIGYNKLDTIKERSNKPYLILIDSPEKIELFAEKPSPKTREIIQKFWPGPLTLLLPAKKNIPSYLKSQDNKVALRVPNHTGLLTLLKKFNGLFSTSANKQNESTPTTVDTINQKIVDMVDTLIKDPQEKETLSSTILDCTGDTIKVIREGSTPLQKIREVCPYL